MKSQLLIPAAGMGLRLGAAMPKALAPLSGRPMLLHTLDRFHAWGLLGDAIVLAPTAHVTRFQQTLDAAYPGAAIRVAPGGAERQHSVALGLAMLHAESEVVLIHDAARPFVAEASVRAVIKAAEECGAATVALPAIDTMLEADADGFLARTPDRKTMWACQTPQAFRAALIRDAHAKAEQQGLAFTDDATLALHAGTRVKLVEGSRLNMKITTPEDYRLAELILREGLA